MSFLAGVCLSALASGGAHAASQDILVVNVSEDAYLGNAAFTVSVDNKTVGGNLSATALHADGDSQNFTLTGTWGTGPHTISVRYLVDAYGGSPSKDRNLYVNEVTYDGVTSSVRAVRMLSAGTAAFPVPESGSGKATLTSIAFSPGVNLSGLEFNSGTRPGRANFDFAVPTPAEMDYYAGKALKVVRLPILWERLQPDLLAPDPTTALDPTYLNLVTTILTYAHAKGMGVIVDLHNYGSYDGIKLGGTGAVSIPGFGAAWKVIAATLKGYPALLGYDMMNEPNGFPSSATWPALAQSGIGGIRASDPTTAIFVEGDAWASAGSWLQYGADLGTLSDPSNRLVYEAHAYGDRDNSGTHFAWAQEAAQGVTVNTIAQRVAVFGGWCRRNAKTCMVGEVGVGNDDPNWNIELANGLAQMKADGLVAATYWAGGPWWGTYPMSIEPRNGADAPQMAVMAPVNP